ncbi:MAG: hypothetical protein N2323_05470 [candidate division WOR-3 bacterium]|nr:hypothetical protein [candidate division WOR-3 bacterium]MCX7837388.1 hypothetical protein [candidate division WOR-3 bacterium]MDW8114315.1 hypothetical protein [candidate division WOR-3 bacterium]
MKDFPIFLIFFIPLIISSCNKDYDFYKNKEYFIQKTIDTKNIDKGIIRAKVDNRWQKFEVVELPEEFLEWNFKERLLMIEKIKRREPLDWSGPHSGMVATYGAKRKDTKFKINCAVKGMGFLPKKEKIKEMINLLKSTINDSFERKINILESLYRNGKEIFDLTKQVSLELYTKKDFYTQTFLNQMVNPACAIVFLDVPSYKLKCLAHLLHPENPYLNEYERDVCEYVNLIHDYFHGISPKKSIVTIYYIIEVFDNSPGKGRGVRVK